MTGTFISALAWSLVHSIWQDAAIAVALGFINAALRRARATTRYTISCAGLLLMLAVPVATFVRLNTIASTRPVHPLHTAAQNPAAMIAITSTSASYPRPEYLVWLVNFWMAGVVVFTLRSVGGFVCAQRMKRRSAMAAAEATERIVSRLAARLNIGRKIRLLESAIAETPTVIGWLRPVVLIPISAMVALTPRQIELLLAHELAHIRRHDYLINIFQTAIETLLFYHPAVWWASEQIRRERENCCDDLAIGCCGDAIAYARTLADLEGLRASPPRLVMAANGGSLLSRIERLLAREAGTSQGAPAWLMALLAAALFVWPGTMSATKSQPARASSGNAAPTPQTGFLSGLAAAGYTSISVDEIIALRENGIDPLYIKAMAAAGLGAPSPADLINLHRNGVTPDFAAQMVQTALVRDLTFQSIADLHRNGADANDFARIRQLGFGPFSSASLIDLPRTGTTSRDFEALKEAGFPAAGIGGAVEIHRYGITPERMRSLRAHGFNNLKLDQIIRLCRAGVI
jgi:beta-lactamase regulating signal transducer with metallopeptidase domain